MIYVSFCSDMSMQAAEQTAAAVARLMVNGGDNISNKQGASKVYQDAIAGLLSCVLLLRL